MTEKPPTKADRLQQQLAELELERKACQKKRDLIRIYYEKVDRTCGELSRQIQRLKQEIKGLKIIIKPGLYKRSNWNKTYIWVSSVRRPRRYTHVKGLYINVNKDDWSEVGVIRFDSNYAYIEESMDRVDKMTFLTTEGFDLEEVVDILEAHAQQEPVKVTSSWNFNYVHHRVRFNGFNLRNQIEKLGPAEAEGKTK